MEETIICPVCGVANPADAQVCANCHASLRLPEAQGHPGTPGIAEGEPEWADRIRGTGLGHEPEDSRPRTSKPLGSQQLSSPGPAAPAPEAIGRTSEREIQEWLRRLDASDAAGATISPATGRSDLASSGTAANGTPTADHDPTHVPDWLHEGPSGRTGSPAAASRDADAPGEASAPAPGAPSGPAPSEVKSLPADAGAPTTDSSSVDVDAVFASLQTPDWISAAVPPTTSPPDRLPPAAADDEPIAPAALPSWVEAMRPVESILQHVASEAEPEQPVERGPLLGIEGVLPAVPGVGRRSNRPRVRAMRLAATEQQRARATIMEQVLADETRPMPLKAAEVPVSQRGLRWAITGLMVILLGGALISKSQIFPLPVGVPNETLTAVRAVEAVPTDSRVLLVFDYEPATVGEMEASAAPLVDHLLLLRHPALALISTSPTGAVLGERLLSGVLAARDYQPGVGYVNLGYLPGGLAGVRAFSENPVAAVPLAADSGPAWDTTALGGIRRLSDFAAVIVITDSLESGRVWIEQTAGQRGQTPMVVVSSAQAGPVLLPYADSGQIAGMVAGLNGAAGAEMANGGLPGFVRRYWDAYTLGLYSAALLILLGAGWQAWVKVRGHLTQEDTI